MGRTMVECLRRDSHSCCAEAPQNTTDTNVENTKPAPYSQQMAGKLYRITCAYANTSCNPLFINPLANAVGMKEILGTLGFQAPKVSKAIGRCSPAEHGVSVPL